MKRSVVLLLACLPSIAFGAMYKCVDSAGHVSYSQTPEPGKRCVSPNLPEVQVIPSPPAPQLDERRPNDTRNAGEKPDSAADKGKELADARKALDQARKNLAEQEAVRYGNERNYQRVLDRLKPFQDAVKQAEDRLKQLEQGSK